MTTTEAPSGSCARCATPRRAGARFCPACGTRLPDVAITLALASIDPLTAPIPLPRPAPETAPEMGPETATDTDVAPPDAPRPRRGPTGLVVACALVTVAAAVTTVAMLGGAPAPVTASAPVAAPVAAPASVPAPAPVKTRSALPAGVVPVVGWSGWTQGTTGYGTVRPPELDADGDGTSIVEDITWQSWGGATATGRGTATWVPTRGSMAGGVDTTAVVVASDLGDCHGRPGYRKVGWYFPSRGETTAKVGYDRICQP